LYIRKEKLQEVSAILEKYKDIKAFDFGDNLMLWVDYFGDFKRIQPPLLVSISTNLQEKSYIRIYNQENKEVSSGVVSADSNLDVALFYDEEYRFDFFSFSKAELFYSETKILKSDRLTFSFANPETTLKEEDTIEIIEGKILDLINSKDYDAEYSNHVKMVSLITGKTNFNAGQLRGGRLEYLFFKLLQKYKDLGKIDDVIWNGRVDEFGIMYPALGGKEGHPDVYFFIKGKLYVLELTTIRANAMQWSAEGASVHDHIMNLQKKLGTSYSIEGIFSAPSIAPRLEGMFKHIAEKENIPHHTIAISDLINEFKKMPNLFNN
jgi:hypothetical protein